MTPEQNLHLEAIVAEFTRKCSAKYQAGQKEHGGDLWKKKHLIDMAIDEAIDQVTYLLTLKYQMEIAGVDLGTIEEK